MHICVVYSQMSFHEWSCFYNMKHIFIYDIVFLIFSLYITYIIYFSVSYNWVKNQTKPISIVNIYCRHNILKVNVSWRKLNLLWNNTRSIKHSFVVLYSWHRTGFLDLLSFLFAPKYFCKVVKRMLRIFLFKKKTYQLEVDSNMYVLVH